MQKGFPNPTSHCTLASKPFVREPTPGPSLLAKEASEWAQMPGRVGRIYTNCMLHNTQS